ncbi:hypothetical protein B0H67DRAFT_660071, partial [Lasiosphaeris hirsuta]
AFLNLSHRPAPAAGCSRKGTGVGRSQHHNLHQLRDPHQDCYPFQGWRHYHLRQRHHRLQQPDAHHRQGARHHHHRPSCPIQDWCCLVFRRSKRCVRGRGRHGGCCVPIVQNQTDFEEADHGGGPMMDSTVNPESFDANIISTISFVKRSSEAFFIWDEHSCMRKRPFPLSMGSGSRMARSSTTRTTRKSWGTNRTGDMSTWDNSNG